MLRYSKILINALFTLIAVLFFVAISFFLFVISVKADSYEGTEGNIDIPGKQVSVIENSDTGAQEAIEEAEGQVVDGVLSVALNFVEGTKFAIKLDEVCGDINNIVIETNKEFTGVLKISDKIDASTEKLQNVLSLCNFEMQGFDNTFIESVVWNLKLNRNSLTDKEVSINNIKLSILDDGEWNNIKTEKTNDSNSESVFYEAKTDNLMDGEVAIIEENNNIFSAQNVAYVVFSVLGLLVLVAIGYLLLKKED